MAKKEKTISYRRAEWANGSGLTLERCVRDALKKLKSAAERTIVTAGHVIMLANHKNHQPGGLFVHIVTDTPGEHASVVPKAPKTAATIDLKTLPPPADGEWLDGDAFLYIKDDHVCLCATQIYDRAIIYYLQNFFDKAGLRKDSTQFFLIKAADITKVKLLQNQGVKEIDLNTTLYKATVDYTKRKDQVVSLLGIVGKGIKTLLQKPNDYTPDGLRVGLKIYTDARFTKKLSLGEKHIKELGVDIVENYNEQDDDYTIITQKGQKITPKEIFLKTKVLLDGDGKSVKPASAWKELARFHDLLVKSGSLAQS